MISIKYLISDKKGGIAHCSEVIKNGNESFLWQDDEQEYPILSEVTTIDIETFFPGDMEDLIQELLKVKKHLNDKSELHHIEEIISLCKICKKRNEGQIVFNPFTNLVRIGKK